MTATGGGLGGRERASLYAGVALSVIALGACVWWAVGQPAPEFPTSPRSLGLLGAALGMLAVSVLLRGFRWSVILRRAGVHVEPVEPYALVVVGYMGNTVLPLRGGEILRIVLLKERSDAGWAGSIGSIIPERILDLVSLTVLLTVLVATGVVDVPGDEATTYIACGVVVTAAVAAAVYLRLRKQGKLESFADKIRPFAHASRLLFTPTGAALLLLSLFTWAVDGSIFWLVAESLDLSIGGLEAVGLAIAVAAFSTIPAGPAFAGTYDAALLVALRALSVAGSAAVSYVILVRFIIFVPVTVVGLLITIVRYGGISRLRAGIRGAGAAPGTDAEARVRDSGEAR